MVGAALSPLAVSPFLSHSTNVDQFQRHLNSNISILQPENTTDVVKSENLLIPFTFSAVMTSLVIPAYIIFYVMHITGQFRIMHYEGNEGNQKFQLPLLFKTISILNFCSFIALCSAIYIGCGDFISSFVVQQFYYSRATAAYITSFFMASGLVGRLLVLWCINYVEYTSLLIFLSAVLVSASGALYICSVYNLGLTILLLSTGFVSFSSHSLLPIIVDVFDKHMFPMTGKMASLAISMEYIGGTANALLKGYLMQEYGPIMFIVIILVQAMLIFILIFSLIFSVNVVQKKQI